VATVTASATSLQDATRLPPAVPAAAAAPAVDLLRPLASQPGAVVLVARLPELWGLDVAAAAELLSRLVDDRLVELWDDAPGGASVVLSGPAAAALGLVLLSPESGRGPSVDRPAGVRELRWQPAAAVRSEKCGLCGVATETDVGEVNGDGGAVLELVADPRGVEPSEAVIRREEVARRPGGNGRPRWEPVPRLLGSGLSPFTVFSVTQFDPSSVP
jgi:hypothetical protein